MSLVEILMALAIALVCTITIFQALYATKEQAVRLDVMIVGRLLAHSILDQALDRFHVEDSRFFTLDTPPQDIHSAIANGEWKKPFLDLACPKTPLITDSDQENPYFDVTLGPALPMETDAPEEFRFWRSFSYELKVDFEIQEEAGTAQKPIDSDGDEKGEVDLARIRAEVFYRPVDRSRPERSVCTFTTLISIRDKTPGVGVFSEL